MESKKLRTTILGLGLAGLLIGCAAPLPADPSKMSAEQLKAAASDRSAMASCSTVNSPWGVGRTIFVQLDQKTIPSGTVTVAADCTVTIQANDKVQPTPRNTTP